MISRFNCFGAAASVPVVLQPLRTERSCCYTAYLIAKSPLIWTVVALALSWGLGVGLTSGWTRTVTIITLSAVTVGGAVVLVAFPKYLPKRFMDEVSIASSVVLECFGSPWWTEIQSVGQEVSRDNPGPVMLLSAIPLKNRHHLETLITKNHVGAVVMVLDDEEEDAETFLSDPVHQIDWESNGVLVHRIRCPDMTPMDFDTMDHAADFLDQQRDTLGKVTVTHCKAGRGRSASIELCYFIKYKNMSFVDAFAALKALRPVVYLTAAQEQALRDYDDRIHHRTLRL